ncbi:MAG: hypothetical protein JXB13_20275 [Phycisphaerae bacterium]|nr:hypothetical protein [Phycisphaerae bacterium]
MKNPVASAFVVLALAAQNAPAAVLYSASFERYAAGDPVVINDTTGANDTFNGMGGPAGTKTFTATAGLEGTGATGTWAGTGKAGFLFWEGDSSGSAINFTRAYLPNIPVGGRMVLSYDMFTVHHREGNGGQVFFRRMSTATSSVGDNCTAVGRVTGTTSRFTGVVNRNTVKPLLPFDTATSDSVNVNNLAAPDTDSPDAVNEHCASTYRHDADLSKPFNVRATTGLDRSRPNETDNLVGFRIDYDGGGATTKKAALFDNLIVTDSVDDAFLAPNGEWRNVRDLPVGTRPTSSFLGAGATPVFCRTNEDVDTSLVPNIAQTGPALSVASILDIDNATDPDHDQGNFGWVRITGNAANEVRIALQLAGPTQARVDDVRLNLAVDAAARSYTASTDDPLLPAGYDLLLTIPVAASGDLTYSWRLGDGAVVLDKLVLLVEPTVGTLLLIH